MTGLVNSATIDDGFGMASTLQSKPADRAKLAMPAALLFVALIMPPETSVHLGGLRLSPYRIVLLATVLPCLIHVLSSRAGRLNGADIAVMLHALLCCLALGNFGGLGQAIESGGIYFIESVGAYLVGRRYIRSVDDFRAMSRFLSLTILALLVFALPESITHIHFLREAFRVMLGGAELPFIEPRLGLARAFGPFEHPILFGVFCSMAFASAFYVARPMFPGAKGWLIVLCVIGASFASLSAGAWLMLSLQIGLIIWGYATRAMPGRWLFLAACIVMAIAMVSVLSNRSPVKVFISYASFSAASSYNRVLIWQYGTAEVARHPFLGVGLGDWERAPWMSDSMDNFWLLIAMRHGIPALLMLTICIGVIAIGAARQSGRDVGWNDCRSAWMVTLAGVSVAACTVHLWNSTFSLFFFFVGSGAWLIDRSRDVQRDKMASDWQVDWLPPGRPDDSA